MNSPGMAKKIEPGSTFRESVCTDPQTVSGASAARTIRPETASAMSSMLSSITVRLVHSLLGNLCPRGHQASGNSFTGVVEGGTR